MRKKNHERPNRIVEINWVQWKLNRVIDKYATDIHHILWQKYKHLYNVNIDQNKMRISRKDHVDYNNFVKDKQNPREAMQKLYEMCKQVLTTWVRRELYTILYETDDEMFYIPELLKWKKKKKTTDTEKKNLNADTD